MFDAGEDRLHGVKIGLRDRIKLVVVTAGAAGRQSEERGTNRVDDVGQFVLSLRQSEQSVLTLDDIVWIRDQKADADRFSESITRDLLLDELVIRFVIVERVDDPVTKPESVRSFAICLEAVGLAEVNNVEPVGSPALPVTRARENPVDQTQP